VVCAALATALAHQLSFPKEELATMCAKAEHYVGTEGGG
jgi:galactokinase